MSALLQAQIHGLHQQLESVARQCLDQGIHDEEAIGSRVATGLPSVPPAVWQLLTQIVLTLLQQWLTPNPNATNPSEES